MADASQVLKRGRILGLLAAALIAVTVPRHGAAAQETSDGRNLLMDKRPIIHDDGPKFGAYDPYGDFSEEKKLSTEHLFLPWEDVELEGLGEADAYARARGRKVLVTIEPWSWALEWNVSPAELRSGILSGKYDANMRMVLSALARFKSPVIIRWAQEPESKTGRFTWSNWNPADYTNAFNRMCGIIRDMLPNAKIMWSPKGEKNLADYYPKDDCVDIVGLSVFGYDAFDKIEYGNPRTFAEAVKQGYDLAAGFGKPIWIAELGYEGDVEYLKKWVQDVTANHAAYPALKEVVYFNDKDVWAWPHGLGMPNWRVLRSKPIYPVRR